MLSAFSHLKCSFYDNYIHQSLYVKLCPLDDTAHYTIFMPKACSELYFSDNYAKAIEKNTLKYAFGNHFSYPFILLENETDTLTLLISVSRCTLDISFGYKMTFLNIYK